MGRPTCMRVRVARLRNLKDVDIDIPLGELVGVAGASGSGESSPAPGAACREGAIGRYL